MSRHCSARLVYGLQLGTNPPKFPAASSALSLPLTHCFLFCVSDSRAVTSETSSLRCHHHTEFSSLYPRDAPFSLSYCVYTPTNRITSARDTLRRKKQNLLLLPPPHLVLQALIDVIGSIAFFLDMKRGRAPESLSSPSPARSLYPSTS